jgi:streptogramin lyase
MSSGAVTTLAGSGKNGQRNGLGVEASFQQPYGVVADGQGNVYVADTGSHSIRKISPTGQVSTVALQTHFKSPHGVALDQEGNLLVADSLNHMVRKITPSGVVSTVAGNGQEWLRFGGASDACFNVPVALAVAQNGSILVADKGSNCIRMISKEGDVTTFVDSGASFSLPREWCSTHREICMSLTAETIEFAR